LHALSVDHEIRQVNHSRRTPRTGQSWQAGPVRWDELFADLEAQLAAEESAERRAEVADRSRREVGRIAFLDRLTAHVGAELVVGVPGGGVVRGRLDDVAAEWLLLEEPPGRPVLIPSGSRLWVTGLTRSSAVPAEHSLARRISLVSALRTLAAHRVSLRLQLTDGSELTGTIDRAYADHLDLAEHHAGEQRRASAVRGVRAVAHRAIAVARST
jgi:hypothetical protein